MKLPDIDNQKLAYETGVHIGDGTMVVCQNSYYVIYYGNNDSDRIYFENVLLPILKEIYDFHKLYVNAFKNTCYIRIYSKDLVKFKSEVIGLPIGSKDRLNLSIIEKFSQNSVLLSQLIAGIFDTDGCVKINRGKYPRLAVALKNENVIKQIQKLLKIFHITSTVYENNYFDKRVDKTET